MVRQRISLHQQRREKLLQQTGLRLDGMLTERVERVAQQVEESTGLRVSRHDVMRVLIEVGLERIEKA